MYHISNTIVGIFYVHLKYLKILEDHSKTYRITSESESTKYQIQYCFEIDYLKNITTESYFQECDLLCLR